MRAISSDASRRSAGRLQLRQGDVVETVLTPVVHRGHGHRAIITGPNRSAEVLSSSRCRSGPAARAAFGQTSVGRCGRRQGRGHDRVVKPG